MIFKKIMNKVLKSDEDQDSSEHYTGKDNDYNKQKDLKTSFTVDSEDYKNFDINIQVFDDSNILEKEDNLSFKDNHIIEERDNSVEEVFTVSDLEEQYEKNIYNAEFSNSFKYSLVLYLLQIHERPLKLNTWLSNILDESTSPEELEEYVFKNDYIRESENGENQELIISSYTVADLKDILRNYNLKLSGRKQELIDRLKDNLSDEELTSVFNKKSYVVTEKGLKLIEENLHVPIYQKYFSHHDLNEYENYYQRNKTDDMKKFSINYLIYFGQKCLEEGNWFAYKWQSLREIAILYFDYEEYQLSLNYFMQTFICDLSFWEDKYYGIEFFRLNDNYTKKIIETVEIVKLDLESLKKEFYQCYDTSKVPLLVIPKESMFKYFLEVINGVSVEQITREIHQSVVISEEYKYYLHYNNLNEMNELKDNLQKYVVYKQ